MSKYLHSRLFLWLPLVAMLLLILSYPLLMITAFSPSANKDAFGVFLWHIFFLFGERFWFWPFIFFIGIIALHLIARGGLADSEYKHKRPAETKSGEKQSRSSGANWFNLFPVAGFLFISHQGLSPNIFILLMLPAANVIIFCVSAFLLLWQVPDGTSRMAKVILYLLGIIGLYVAWQIGAQSDQSLYRSTSLYQQFEWALPLHIGTALSLILHYFIRKSAKLILAE